MAVIAVGDFDKSVIEKLIHEQFDSVPESLYNSMLNERFNGLSIKKDPPFMGAASTSSPLATIEYFSIADV